MTQHISLEIPSAGHSAGIADRLVNEAERARITGIARSTWYKMMRCGQAPAPVQIGGRAVRWRYSDLQAWINCLPQQKNGWSNDNGQ